jgi:hypothetical protein
MLINMLGYIKGRSVTLFCIELKLIKILINLLDMLYNWLEI